MAAVALKAAPSEGAQERRWSPYVDNGGSAAHALWRARLRAARWAQGAASRAHGSARRAVTDACVVAALVCSTVVAVAGTDFAVIAGDLRMSYGYSIASRNVPKLHEL